MTQETTNWQIPFVLEEEWHDNPRKPGYQYAVVCVKDASGVTMFKMLEREKPKPCIQ